VEVIKSVTQFIEEIICRLEAWDDGTTPWFRGESDYSKHPKGHRPLCPKIAMYDHYHENYVLQSFRRKAGALANVPHEEDVHLWLFLAQHYGVPTRLLDWTEGALHALFFAINNEDNVNPRVYMLNPHKLNRLAGIETYPLNYPLIHDVPYTPLYVSLAWGNRLKDKLKGDNRLLSELKPQILQLEAHIRGIGNETSIKMADKLRRFASEHKDPVEIVLPVDLSIPIAFPATYQDQRMIAQRSCFTIHGTKLESIKDILRAKKVKLEEYLFEFPMDSTNRGRLLRDLSVLGISEASIFPDLDHLAKDLEIEIENDLNGKRNIK
jgi:hypothetical protein